MQKNPKYSFITALVAIAVISCSLMIDPSTKSLSSILIMGVGVIIAVLAFILAVGERHLISRTRMDWEYRAESLLAVGSVPVEGSPEFLVKDEQHVKIYNVRPTPNFDTGTILYKDEKGKERRSHIKYISVTQYSETGLILGVQLTNNKVIFDDNILELGEFQDITYSLINKIKFGW